MKTEKKNFKTKLHLACGSDDLRPQFQYIIFEDGYAVATDAHMLIQQDLESHGFNHEELERLEGYAIHREQFRRILSYFHLVVSDYGVISCYDKHNNETTVKLVKLEDLEMSFPDWKKVMPSTRELLGEVGIDLNLLAKAKDLTLDPEKRVKIAFSGKSKGIILRGISEVTEKEMILIMPVSLD